MASLRLHFRSSLEAARRDECGSVETAIPQRRIRGPHRRPIRDAKPAMYSIRVHDPSRSSLSPLTCCSSKEPNNRYYVAWREFGLRLRRFVRAGSNRQAWGAVQREQPSTRRMGSRSQTSGVVALNATRQVRDDPRGLTTSHDSVRLARTYQLVKGGQEGLRDHNRRWRCPPKAGSP
jgi:hypothetical protein